MKNELFILAPGIFEAVTRDEVGATCDALEELELCNLPYPVVDVQFITQGWGRRPDGQLFLDIYPPEDATRFGDKNTWLIEGLGGESPRVYFFAQKRNKFITLAEIGKPDRLDDVAHITENMCVLIRYVLITLLATRNAVKDRKESKLASLGIGKSRPGKGYRYVTTISVPHVSTMESVGEGKHKRPHLRRGYLRNQRFGPEFAYVKKVWIEPVFVNFDPSFKSERVAYNVD